MEATQEFSRKPLLSSYQVTEVEAEMKSMDEMLANPLSQNKPQIAKQLRTVRKNYAAQVPQPPKTPEEEGRMVARSKWLLEQIVPSMCSQAEMRKAPPGSVDKFRKGENGTVIKPLIAEWQNLQKRLHPGDTEAANLERHRPTTSTLNMDNAAIPGKIFFMPPAGAGMPVVFSDEQLAMIRLVDPATAEKLSTMPNDVRAQVKAIMEKAASGETPSTVTKITKQKRKLTAKQKTALKAGRDKRNKKVA